MGELRKAIKGILKDADLDNLSAKKVRLSLQEQYDTDLTDKKKEIDQLVMELIEESQEEQEEDASSEEELEDEPPQKKKKATKAPTAPKSKPKPKKTKEEVPVNDEDDESDEDKKDEELAQQLQEELNNSGRRTRSRNAPKKKRERKTLAKGDRKGKSAYSKPCILSSELAEVMGSDRLARNEVVKKMWEIVKERNLQDPSNRQYMLCDEQLLGIFGKKKVKTFGMMKYLKNHIKDAKDIAS